MKIYCGCIFFFFIKYIILENFTTGAKQDFFFPYNNSQIYSSSRPVTHDNTGLFTAKQPFCFFSCDPLPMRVVVTYNFVRKIRCLNSLDKLSATHTSVPAAQQVEGKHQMSIQQAA